MTVASSTLDLLASLTDHVGIWGENATPLQWEDAIAMLDLEGPRRHWIGRAKGYSKTRDVGAVSLVALLEQFRPGATGYVAASDADQATLLRQSIGEFVANSPGLRALVAVDNRKVTVKSNGAELIILAADSAGSHGLRPFWLVVDELGNWPAGHHEFFDSLWAGLPKVAASRGIVITTAGAPHHFSARVFEAAQGEPTWRCSNVIGPPPWIDSEEVEAERRRLIPSFFARLWMNEWVAGEDSIADPDDVDAACTLDGPLAPQPGTRYTITLDLGTRRDRTAAVIAHAEQTAMGTRVIADRLEVWTPSRLKPVSLDEVRAWLLEMSRSYNNAPVVYDPSQAYLLVEQLRKAYVRTEEFVFTSSSVGKLATDLMQALRGRLITLPNDQALRDEILSVRLRESSPNVLRIDHASGAHDDRVIAVAMAASHLSHTGPALGTAWLEAWKAEARFGGADAIPKGYFDSPVASEFSDVDGQCQRSDCCWEPYNEQVEKCDVPGCPLYRDKEA
jgi:hypothetical protein